MQALNAAYDRARQHRVVAESSPPAPPPAPGPVPPGPPQETPQTRHTQRVQYDSPSFTVDALPATTFEALTLVASWMGEVIIENSPHMIECLLDEPLRCWCRLDIAPEGDSSSVSLIVERYEDEPAPDIDSVRDEWVANLNRTEKL